MLWLAFYASIVAAWIALYAASLAAPWRDAPVEDRLAFWQALCTSAAEAGFSATFGMWALMSLAMMMPTFVPTLRTFDDLSFAKASDPAAMACFVGAYGAVWLGFSGLAALLHVALARWSLIAPDGGSLSPWLTAALLLGAGTYQFSVLKHACLAKCRHPIAFFMQHWRPGNAAAFAMGLRLGGYCLGCCWALMLLGFVGGAMDIAWMGLATLFMILEKLREVGRFASAPAGILLTAAGLVALARAMGVV
jgi:predicted metal-binding membrane protein